MDKIQKALHKLSSKEREQIKKALNRLFRNQLSDLDIKKLKTRNDIFRLKVGDLRVIFRKKSDKIFILAISRRSEKTYKI